MTDNTIIEEIKSKLDLEAIVSKHVTLKKSGRALAGLCPFHREKTPSFVVWPDTQTWRCFGSCNCGGDVFSFVMKRENWTFGDALRELARQAGVELHPLAPEEKKKLDQARARAEQLTELYQFAAEFYAGQLQANQAGLDYLAGRGLAPNYVAALGWGYSAANEALHKSMLKSKPKLIPLAREIGLVRADGKDFTANADGARVAKDGWIVFTHYDHGRLAGLSARAIGDVATGGKTRNLPDQVLPYAANFTLRAGKQIVAQVDDDVLVVLEGAIDAETNRVLGKAAYGMGGPAPSSERDARVVFLRKMQEKGVKLYLGMSNDKNQAGDGYARKLANYLDPLTRIVYWPRDDGAKKSDANSWFTAGASAEDLAGLLAGSESYLDILIGEARRKSARDKTEATEAIAGLVARLDDTSRRMYVKIVVDKLRVSTKDFERLVTERLPKTDNNGITIKNGELCLWGQPLVSGIIRIDKQQTLDDGMHQPQIAYCVSGKKPNGEALHVLDRMPSDEFESPRWMGRYWGADMYTYVGAGKYHQVKQAILKHGEKDMKRETIYTFTGWHNIAGRRVFLSKSGALNERLDTQARVELMDNMAHYCLTEPPTGEQLTEAIHAWLDACDIAPPTVTIPMFCAMYAALFTNEKSLDTIIDIVGPTQGGKSTLSHVFLSAFGPGFIRDRQYYSPQNWRSTPSDIEATMFTCKDVPLIIDDYVPQVEPDQIKKSSAVIRSLGNRAPRGRRNADMSAQARFIPRGLVLMTSEQPLNDEGIVGRVLYVHITRDSIDRDKLTFAQSQHHLYSQAMSAYISYLAENWQAAADEFKHLVQQSLVEVRGVFAHHERLCDYFAVLNSAATMAYRWMRNVGALSAAEAEDKITLAKVALLEVLEKQLDSLRQQSPVYKFFHALEDLMTQQRVVFAPKNSKDWSPPYNTIIIGWRGENLQINHAEFHLPDRGASWVWLLVSPALREVKGYLDGLDEPYRTLKDAFVREMRQAGVVARQGDSSHIGVRLGSGERIIVVDAVRVLRDYGVNMLGLDAGGWANLLGSLGLDESQVNELIANL